VTPFALFMMANLVLQLGSLLCMITVLVQMFTHEETGWAIACSVLFFCGCGLLIAFIYGWSKVGEWDISLLMVAWSLCIVGMIIQFAIMLATVGMPVP
jgi:hypothetical protein